MPEKTSTETIEHRDNSRDPAVQRRPIMPRVYDVCVRTADAGRRRPGQVPHRRPDAPTCSPARTCSSSPSSPSSLDDGQRAVGYVIGTRTRRVRPRLPGALDPPAGRPLPGPRRIRRATRRRNWSPCTTTRSGWSWPGLEEYPGAPAHRPAAAVPGGRPRPGPDGDVLRRRGPGRGDRGARQRDQRYTPGRSASTIVSASARWRVAEPGEATVAVLGRRL